MSDSLSKRSSEEQPSAAGLLHLAQKRFSDLLGALPIGIILARADGQIESVNKPIVELFGYSEKELIGANISKLFFHPPWANSAGLLEWYEKQGQNLIELRGLALGNEVVPIDLGVRLLNAERTDRLLLVVQDVTERFISNQVKRGFFQMINHDLRSPLTNVVMFLKMMEKREDFGTLTPIGRERLMAAALNVDRILHLADDLLQLESLESAVDKMKMEKIDVEHLIEQAIKSVTETAAAKSITIERQIEDGIQSLTGDAFRLEQVLVNLLSNGIGYSKPGLAMKLVVRASESMLYFGVHDNGPGVPESEKLLIFEKFKQGSKKGAGSFGLGLAICSEIVRQHGGSIGCKDNPSGGSIFWFEIPAQNAEAKSN